jgi:uncharacterized protein YkvS
MAIAAIGAVLGLFPLFTSRPFRSSEEDKSHAAESRVLDRENALDVKFRQNFSDLDLTSETLSQPHEADTSEYFLSLESSLYSNLRQPLGVSGQYLPLYDIESASLNLRSYMATKFANLNERSARVKEVCDLVDKLRGAPETYSIELTSNNSIIVRCEGQSENASIMDQFEKQMQDFDDLTDTPVTSIQ